jgi:hypothetical protein
MALRKEFQGRYVAFASEAARFANGQAEIKVTKPENPPNSEPSLASELRLKQAF